MFRLLLVFTVLFSACQKSEENTFSFASSGEFRPFSFTDNNGELMGYDIEVGKELAKRLGKKPVAVKFKFTGIVEGVKNGRFDAGVASQTITEERKQHVAFSIPYYYSGTHIYSSDTEKLKIEIDLKYK